jgi:hypothetical protein
LVRRRGQALVPIARAALDQLKFTVIREIGVAKNPATASSAADPRNYSHVLDRFKWHIAEELGLDQKVRSLGWADMPSRECGSVGGHLGGQIGGQMVRRMIALAEERLSQGVGGANFLPGANFGRPGPTR